MVDDLEPFESPLLLVGAAEEDIIKVKAACADFIKNCKYVPFEQFDLKTSEKIIKLRFEKGIPGELRVSFSRIVNELRHALDQAVCDGALVLGATSAKGIYFPFGRDKRDFDNEVKERLKKVNPDLRKFIAAFNAYFGGDSFLWSLTKLAARKHQRVIALHTDKAAMVLHGAGLDIKGPVTININKWNDNRRELEFARVGPGGHIHMNLDLRLEVVIGKGDVVLGQPVASTLDLYASKVESIVLGIKAESERLVSLLTHGSTP